MTSLTAAVAENVKALADEQKQSIRTAKSSLKNLPVWKELNAEEQAETLGKLDDRLIKAEPNLAGLKDLVNNEFSLSTQAGQTAASVTDLGQRRIAERLEAERKKNEKAGKQKLEESITLPTSIQSYDDFKSVKESLQVAEEKSKAYSSFEYKVELKDQ